MSAHDDFQTSVEEPSDVFGHERAEKMNSCSQYLHRKVNKQGYRELQITNN